MPSTGRYCPPTTKADRCHREPRPGHARVVFDERFWEQDVARATDAGARVAQQWRRDAEERGVYVKQLRACQADGRDGTHLPACVKLYLPAPAGPWGAVLVVALDPAGGRAALDFLAYGPRHPSTARRASVYQVAHQRLNAS